MTRECGRGHLPLNVLHARKGRLFSLVEISAMHHGVKLPVSGFSVSPRTRVYLDPLFDGRRCRRRFSFDAMLLDETFHATLHLAEAHFLEKRGRFFGMLPVVKFFEGIDVYGCLRMQVFRTTTSSYFPHRKERCGHVSPVLHRSAATLALKSLCSEYPPKLPHRRLAMQAGRLTHRVQHLRPFDFRPLPILLLVPLENLPYCFHGHESDGNLVLIYPLEFG